MEENRRTRRPALLAAGLLSFGTAGASLAGEHDWRASASLNYETGTYGTSARSSSLYVPLTLKHAWEDWHASFTVPYVSLTSDGQVTNVGGKPVKVRGGRGRGAATTRSGVGDAVLGGGYAILKEDVEPFDLTAVATLKFPTADKTQGLGTGEFDAGLGLEFGKLVSPGWTLLADARVTLIGDPPGTDLNDQVAAGVGVSRLLREDLSLTVLLEGSNALVPGEPGPLDLRAVLDCRLNDHFSLNGGGMAGLTDGSPDFGLALGAGLRF